MPAHRLSMICILSHFPFPPYCIIHTSLTYDASRHTVRIKIVGRYVPPSRSVFSSRRIFNVWYGSGVSIFHEGTKGQDAPQKTLQNRLDVSTGHIQWIQQPSTKPGAFRFVGERERGPISSLLPTQIKLLSPYYVPMPSHLLFSPMQIH